MTFFFQNVRASRKQDESIISSVTEGEEGACDSSLKLALGGVLLARKSSYCATSEAGTRGGDAAMRDRESVGTPNGVPLVVRCIAAKVSVRAI